MLVHPYVGILALLDRDGSVAERTGGDTQVLLICVGLVGACVVLEFPVVLARKVKAGRSR